MIISKNLRFMSEWKVDIFFGWVELKLIFFYLWMIWQSKIFATYLYMSLCNFANMAFRQRYIRQWRMSGRYLSIGENQIPPLYILSFIIVSCEIDLKLYETKSIPLLIIFSFLCTIQLLFCALMNNLFLPIKLLFILSFSIFTTKKIIVCERSVFKF